VDQPSTAVAAAAAANDADRAAPAALACADTWLAGPALVSALVTYVGMFHYLNNMPLDNPLLFGIQARFWMQPNWLACLFAGVRLHALATAVARALGALQAGRNGSPPAHQASGHDTPPRSGDTAAAAVALAVCLALVLAQVRASFWHADQSTNWVFAGYAEAVLAPLPDQSLLLINYDQQWTSCRCESIKEKARIFVVGRGSRLGVCAL
jgi:hypothetical protein